MGLSKTNIIVNPCYTSGAQVNSSVTNIRTLHLLRIISIHMCLFLQFLTGFLSLQVKKPTWWSCKLCIYSWTWLVWSRTSLIQILSCFLPWIAILCSSYRKWINSNLKTRRSRYFYLLNRAKLFFRSASLLIELAGKTCRDLASYGEKSVLRDIDSSGDCIFSIPPPPVENYIFHPSKAYFCLRVNLIFIIHLTYFLFLPTSLFKIFSLTLF
jgi:hypothetical protein